MISLKSVSKVIKPSTVPIPALTRCISHHVFDTIDHHNLFRISQIDFDNTNVNQRYQFANEIKQHSLNENKSAANSADPIYNVLNKVEIFDNYEMNEGTDDMYLTNNQHKILDKLISTTYNNPQDIMNAFYMVDLGDIIRQHIQWKRLLPFVYPFYAVKCNPDPVIVSLLNYLGCSFDCASKNEIDLLRSNNINIKNQSNNYDKIIFSHPCKHPLHLEYANYIGVDLCTFDNEHELDKINQFHPNCKSLLRIQVDDSQSICKFNSKYGYNVDDINDIYKIFDLCKKYHNNLRGIMFHVGSGCLDCNVYNTAIEKSKAMFDIAHNKYDYDKNDMNILDLGGGFPGDIIYSKNNITFEEIASVVNKSLQYYFGNEDGYKFIAEPGRFYVSKSHTLVCDIIAKKKNSNDTIMYYINDGMYGSFNAMYFDHAEPVIIPYTRNDDDEHEKNEMKYKSTIFGPTCDAMDKMYDDYKLKEMNVLDKMVVPAFGAYTNAAATEFNGFEKSKSRYVMTL